MIKVLLGVSMAALSFCTGGSQPHVHQWGRMTQSGQLPCFSVADSEETGRTSPILATLVIEELRKDQRAVEA